MFNKRLVSSVLLVVMLLVFVSGCTNVADNASTPDSSWDKEVDLLVIGAGGSGLSAAVEAADNGAENILIIEKLPSFGGTTFVSQGMIAGYDTEISKKLDVNHTEEELYNLLMSNSDYRLDPELSKITVKKSGESIDWLINTIGVDFIDEIYVGYGPLQMMHVVDGGGIALKEPFSKAMEERNIELMLETPGKELITDESGNVIGALAEKDGADFRIKAKATIIATGGYAANTELAKTLNPSYDGLYGVGHPGTTGDGIIMASNIGAAISNSVHLMGVFKDYEILENHKGNSDTANVSPFIAAPNALFVGAEGKRFVNEKSGGFMNQNIFQPILDQMHKDGSDYVWAITDQSGIESTNAKRGLDLDFIQADSIEELAKLMNIDSTELKATVDRWNEMTVNGVDTDFDRKTGLDPLENGPYYAVSIVPCHIITYGGILRNVNSEALRADGSVISGLYTAGEASANSAYMGFTLANCFAWGRIAGENAANFIKNK